jgi:predicted RecA/RadA family phage recombinase
MKAKFIQDGNSIDYTPGADVAAGDVVIQGDLVAIAKLAIVAGVPGSLAATGVFDVAKATDEAIVVGAKTFWSVADQQATATATGNVYMGEAIAAAAETDTTVRVRLGGPATPTALPSAGAVIASLTDDSTGIDPGDDIIAVVTAAEEITDDSSGIDPGDDIIAELTNAANAGSADIAPVSAAIAQLAAKENTNSAAVTALAAAVAQLVVNQNLILARLRTYGVIAAA